MIVSDDEAAAVTAIMTVAVIETVNVIATVTVTATVTATATETENVVVTGTAVSEASLRVAVSVQESAVIDPRRSSKIFNFSSFFLFFSFNSEYFFFCLHTIELV